MSETVSLGEVAQVIAGQHIEAQLYNGDAQGIPYLTGPADFGDVVPTITKWTTVPKVLASSRDVLVTVKGAGVGKSNMGCDAAIGRQLMALRPIEGRTIQAYLFHFIRSQERKIARLADGATVPGLGKSDLSNLSLPAISINEQRRIVTILDKADGLRRKRKRALYLFDSLSQSIFMEMFGDLVEARNFARGTVSDWVADFETGKNLAPDPDARQRDGYRVLKVSAVTTGAFLPSEAKPLPSNYKPPASHVVRQGDLLFSRANTAALIGATAYVESTYEKLVLPDKIWRFVWREGNTPNPRFIHALFSTPSFRRQLSKRATGTSGSMKNISKAKVLGLEVGLPNRDQQDQFAVRQQALQSIRSAAIAQLAMLDVQFSSLQSRAFSGQL